MNLVDAAREVCEEFVSGHLMEHGTEHEQETATRSIDNLRAALAREEERQRIIEGLAEALRDLRREATITYKIGAIPATPFVRAGNALAAYDAMKEDDRETA